MVAASDERRELLDGFFRAERTIGELQRMRASDGADPRVRVHEGLYTKRLADLRERYLSWLPRVALARDPFTGDVFAHSLDTAGLDGLWWRYGAPVRPVDERPARFFALTGAVRLGRPVAPAPFLCEPGPEVPYVVPDLFERTDVVAVLSSVPIGPHAGYAVTYFSKDQPAIVRVNEWGTDRYTVSVDGGIRWGERVEIASELDFDLAPWIERKRLRWIAPGDPELTLRDAVAGCPYLGLEGSREIVRIYDGEVIR